MNASFATFASFPTTNMNASCSSLESSVAYDGDEHEFDFDDDDDESLLLEEKDEKDENEEDEEDTILWLEDEDETSIDNDDDQTTQISADDDDDDDSMASSIDSNCMALHVRAIEGACDNWAMIRKTIPATQDYRLVVGKLLFQNIFAIAPQAKALYSFLSQERLQQQDDIYELPAFQLHCQKVIEMLETVLITMVGDSPSQDNLNSLGDALQGLGCKHVQLGVGPEHYKVLETALLQTLEVALGQAWNDTCRSGWAAVISFIAKGMQTGAMQESCRVEIERMEMAKRKRHDEDQQNNHRRQETTLDEETHEKHYDVERELTLRMKVLRRSEGTPKLKRGLPTAGATSRPQQSLRQLLAPQTGPQAGPLPRTRHRQRPALRARTRTGQRQQEQEQGQTSPQASKRASPARRRKLLDRPPPSVDLTSNTIILNPQAEEHRRWGETSSHSSESPAPLSPPQHGRPKSLRCSSSWPISGGADNAKNNAKPPTRCLHSPRKNSAKPRVGDMLKSDSSRLERNDRDVNDETSTVATVRCSSTSSISLSPIPLVPIPLTPTTRSRTA